MSLTGSNCKIRNPDSRQKSAINLRSENSPQPRDFEDRKEKTGTATPAQRKAFACAKCPSDATIHFGGSYDEDVDVFFLVGVARCLVGVFSASSSPSFISVDVPSISPPSRSLSLLLLLLFLFFLCSSSSNWRFFKSQSIPIVRLHSSLSMTCSISSSQISYLYLTGSSLEAHATSKCQQYPLLLSLLLEVLFLSLTVCSEASLDAGDNTSKDSSFPIRIARERSHFPRD